MSSNFDNWAGLEALFARRHGQTLKSATGVNPEKLLKVVRRNTKPVTIYNVSVKGPSHGHMRGIEDATYELYPVLYEYVPRTMVIQESSSDGELEIVLEGIPKFKAYSSVDEDDVDVVDADRSDGSGGSAGPGFVEDPRVVQYFFSHKVNGHMWLATCKFGRVYAGTKACTFCVDNLGPSMPVDDASYPSKMVADIFRELQIMYTTHGEPLMELLRSEVLVGEVETNQHMVYHAEPVLRVFNTSAASSLFQKPALDGPVDIVEFTTDMLQARLRSGYNSEGIVLVCMDASGAIVKRFKFKKYWYIACRALRELFQDTLTLAEVKVKFLTRILSHNMNYMKVDHDFLARTYREYFSPLIDFMFERKVSKKDISFSGSGFAPVLEMFRERLGKTYAEMDALFTVPGLSSFAAATFEYQTFLHTNACTGIDAGGVTGGGVGAGSGSGSGLVVESGVGGGVGGGGGVFAGMCIASACMGPGTGKSTIMKRLAAKLSSSVFGGKACRDMSQDDFAPNTKEFYPGLERALMDGGGTCVLVHRCNFMARDRARFLEVASRNASGGVVMVVPDTPKSVDMLYVGLRGVLEDERKSHPTLGEGCKKTRHELLAIAGSFWGACASVQPHEAGVSKIVAVPIIRESVPKHIADILAPFAKLLSGAKPFSIQAFPLHMDVDGLVAALLSGPEIRRGVDDIVEDIFARIQGMHSLAPLAPLRSVGTSPAPASSPVLYVALAVPVQKDLIELAKCNGFVPSRSSKTSLSESADHITVLYKPTPAQVETYRPHLNRKFDVKVKQIVSMADGTLVAAAVTVDGFLHALDDHAHITLYWVPRSRKPVQSRDMLAGKLGVTHSVPVDKTLSATLKFVYSS